MTRATRTTLMIGAAALAACIFLYVAIWKAFDDPDNQLSRERKLCDREVALLLNSSDLVDVVRAASITSQLDCSIGRRIPKTNPTAGLS